MCVSFVTPAGFPSNKPRAESGALNFSFPEPESIQRAARFDSIT
jgi:hypothetical protein